jgi:hypothetical protein
MVVRRSIMYTMNCVRVSKRYVKELVSWVKTEILVPMLTRGNLIVTVHFLTHIHQLPLVMYWYISFLRPPAVTVLSSSREITITPQVANDLRTEYVGVHPVLALPRASIVFQIALSLILLVHQPSCGV